MKGQITIYAELMTMARQHGDAPMERKGTAKLNRAVTDYGLFQATVEAAQGDEEELWNAVMEAGLGEAKNYPSTDDTSPGQQWRHGPGTDGRRVMDGGQKDEVVESLIVTASTTKRV